MRTVTIVATCDATVTEHWTVSVPDEWDADQIEAALHNGFEGAEFLAVENVRVDDERDREFVRIEEASTGARS